MNLSFIQLGLLGFVRLAAATFVAGGMSSPMSWSPDGEWLSYTVVIDGEQDQLRPGWIFRSASDDPLSPVAHAPLGHRTGAPQPVYRIWATHRGHQPSVLIEESHWPITAPTWSPRGKSIAFGRFVPQSIEPAQSIQKGRYEVVIQNNLDRKQVVWSLPDFELDPIACAGLPQLSCAWSTDGLYLAIPRPGRQPAVEIVRTETKKRVYMIERASLPSWSPDGSKCAFIRQDDGSNRLEYVERLGQSFGEPRVIAGTGVIASTPHWTGDNHSIFAVVERTTNFAVMEKTPSRSGDLDIVRFSLGPNETTRLMPLAPDSARRRPTIRGLAIDYDRERERCFFAVDLEGRDHDMVWSIPRERVTHKRFHPLDISQRIEALAVAPDGQLVAVRFGSPWGLTPPALYDTESEQTTLLIPDLDARKEWLSVLADTAGRLLKSSLPSAEVQGQPARRPTLLALPGELQPLEITAGRVSRLARFGSALCARPAVPPENADRQPTSAFDAEARLFFHYLRGDYQAAASDLENLEPFVSAPRERLGLLSVRAQLLWLRGEESEARAVIDYLVSCEGPNQQLVEDTPLGPVLTPYTSPQQAWARYFLARLVNRAGPKTPAAGELPVDVIDPRLQAAPPVPEMPLIERGAGGPVPFAPRVPVGENR